MHFSRHLRKHAAKVCDLCKRTENINRALPGTHVYSAASKFEQGRGLSL